MTTDAERLAAHQARRGKGKKPPNPELTYREQLGFKRFTDMVLDDWFVKLKPAGSGPLGVMRMACALIEEIRDLRKPIKADVDPKTLPMAVHGTQEDVLTRCAMLNVAYLRNPEASKRDEIATQLAERIDALSRLAAARTEGEAALVALTTGWNVTYNPGASYLTDAANEKFRWSIRRSDAFPSPYGCYVTKNSKREFKNMWNGPVLSEVLKEAINDMASSTEED